MNTFRYTTFSLPGSPCPAPNLIFQNCITTLGRLLTFWQRDHSVKPRLLSTPPNWRFTQIEKQRRNTSGSNLWESHDITGWSPGGLDGGSSTRVEAVVLASEQPACRHTGPAEGLPGPTTSSSRVNPRQSSSTHLCGQCRGHPVFMSII